MGGIGAGRGESGRVDALILCLFRNDGATRDGEHKRLSGPRPGGRERPGLLGRFDGERLALDEVHRFPNGPVRMLDTLHWDLPRLFDEIKTALGKAAAAKRLGSTAWGSTPGASTSGWSAADDTLLGNPVHYRDARTEGMIEAAFQRDPPRADLRDHRPPVPAVQHGLSASGDAGGGLAAAGRRPRRC